MPVKKESLYIDYTNIDRELQGYFTNLINELIISSKLESTTNLDDIKNRMINELFNDYRSKLIYINDKHKLLKMFESKKNTLQIYSTIPTTLTMPTTPKNIIKSKSVKGKVIKGGSKKAKKQ